MTDLDKSTKIMFGGRRQGKSLAMKEYQMTIFKEAMRKAFNAGSEYQRTGHQVRTPPTPDFETFFADFENDIRNGPRSHAKHDTHMQVVGRALREKPMFHGRAENYLIQAQNAEDTIRRMVAADYAETEIKFMTASMTSQLGPDDTPFKGLAAVKREIEEAFRVPPDMVRGRSWKEHGAITGRFSSKAPHESNPPRGVWIDEAPPPPVATIVDDRDVSDAQDAEAVADEFMNRGDE